MVFSSILFLFRFLPIVLLIYYLCPFRLKNAVILIASLIFYAWGEPRFILLMFASILADYCAGLGIEFCRERGVRWGTRAFLGLSLVFNLGSLGFFKYAGFFLDNLRALGFAAPVFSVALPLGISFYTFQTMSYSIDVYRGAVKAERNLLNFATFVCLFPQLIAGPIVKYSDINEELHRRRITSEDLEQGARIFLLGLGSKVLLANQIGQLWDEMAAIGYERLSMPLAWLGILAYALQIYFDFSGYSLMAIGLGRLLGFKFPENFRFPYASRSITEFWRRWHITLGSWFREYLYIPLGGNRKGKYRTIFNLFVVWAATGFWHGASWNFMFWGLYFFVFLLLERAFLRGAFAHLPSVFGHIYALVVVYFGWVLFKFTDFSVLSTALSGMFGGTDVPFSNFEVMTLIQTNLPILILSAVACTPVVPRVGAWLYRRSEHSAAAWSFYRLVVIAAPVVLLLLATMSLVGDSYNPFLYWKF